jgi:hypothetical protein
MAQVFLKHIKAKSDLIHTIPIDTVDFIDNDVWNEVVYIESLTPKSMLVSDIWTYRINVINKLIFKYKLERETIDYLYYFNDCDITNQLILRSMKVHKLIFLDDGFTIASEILEKPRRNRFANFKIGLKSLIGLYDNYFLSYNNRIDKLFIFGSNVSKRKNIFELSDIILNNLDYVTYLSTKCNMRLDNYARPDYIVLTQPLTEQNLCKEGEDVEIIKNYVHSIPETERILIKLHPSEKIDKYRDIQNRKNIKILDSQRGIPYELIHIQLKPINLVSFFSFALFTSQYFYQSKILSLVKRLPIDNKDKYVEALNILFQDNISYL